MFHLGKLYYRLDIGNKLTFAGYALTSFGMNFKFKTLVET